MKLYNNLGHCRLVDHMGDDYRVADAARQSFNKRKGRRPEEQDAKLINYLMKHHHTSPFEQCNMTFLIRMPIFVMRQFVRHRTFRLNEESARYSEMRDDFYVPVKWREQNTVGNKQGSRESDRFEHNAWTAAANNLCSRAYRLYEQMLGAGIAREQARMILPVNLMTEIVVNIDLHNLMHFLVLRLNPHAQQEIRDLACVMLQHMQETYPIVSQAFIENVLKPKGLA